MKHPINSKTMSTRKIFLSMVLIFGVSSISVAYTTSELMNGIALGAILFTLILIGIVCLVMLKTFKVIADMLLPKEEKTLTPIASSEFILEPSKPKLTLWEKLLSLSPLSEEKELIIEYVFDVIF